MDSRSTKGWEEKITFKAIAQGSVIHESSFDAHPNETMATMYYLDGNRLLLTHYDRAQMRAISSQVRSIERCLTTTGGHVIKLVYCISKRPDLTDAEFFHYWRHVHGPIGAKIPGLRRLVQSHTTRDTARIRAADFDGMAELWFDDMAALLAARDSPEWRASTEDEVNFIDNTRVAFFVTEEHEIV